MVLFWYFGFLTSKTFHHNITGTVFIYCLRLEFHNPNAFISVDYGLLYWYRYLQYEFYLCCIHLQEDANGVEILMKKV